MDFALANPNVATNALIENWSLYSQRLRLLCEREKKYKLVSTWSDDVTDLLRLLMIFPSKGKGCEKLFDQKASKLITFSVVSCC